MKKILISIIKGVLVLIIGAIATVSFLATALGDGDLGCLILLGS